MQIQAAVSYEGAPAPVLETLELEVPRANEILVRIVATGVCHTDVKTHEHLSARPFVLGHEGAGVVERVGSDVHTLKPGDHVVLSLNTCGVCPACRSGQATYCRDVGRRNFSGARMDGASPLSKDGEAVAGFFFGQSSFATYAIAEAASAVAVPKDLPLEKLGPLGCGVATGAGAILEALKLAEGQTLAVFGAGSVGLSAVMAAKLSGASRIIAVDVVASRLELAKSLGATDVFDATTPKLGELIREHLGGGVDFSFVTASAKSAFDAGLAALAPRGALGFVTPPPADWAPDMRWLMQGGRRIEGILMGGAPASQLIPKLIAYYQEGRFPFDRLIRFYPFADIAKAFHDMETGETLKPVLLMPA